MSKNTLTIILVGPSLNSVSGVATHLNQLMASDLNKEVNFVHFDVGSEGKNEGVISKITRVLTSPFSLAQFILKKKASIVHLNTSLDAKAFWRDIFYLIVAKIIQTKVVYQIHGGNLQQFIAGSNLFRRFLKFIFGLPDVVVVICTQELDAHKRLENNHQRLEMIANAIDMAYWQPSMAKAEKENSDLRLVYIGRLAEDKGVIDILDAVDLLINRDKIINIHLDVAGSGPMFNTLKERASQSNLEQNISFLGPIFGSEKLELWQKADLFLFPTYHNEGLPYSILESLATGTPAITTRIGGNIDVIQDGKQGVFVEPRNPEMLAHAIKSFVDDRELLEYMAQECVQRVNEYYDVGRMSTNFKQLYHKLLE